jgi:hypothetical protein
MLSNFERFETLTRSVTTTSDKIRVLGREGVRTAVIAKYLNIRHQHARNVLVAAGLYRDGRDSTHAAQPSVQPGAEEQDQCAWLEISADGTVKLPPQLLKASGLSLGDRAHVRLSADSLEILSKQAALKRAQAMVRKYVPEGASLVDDLIAERRREAQMEAEGR